MRRLVGTWVRVVAGSLVAQGLVLPELDGPDEMNPPSPSAADSPSN